MSHLKWFIDIDPKARRQLKKLPPKAQAGVLREINTLAAADNPLALTKVKHVEGRQPKQYRRTAWPYRIFFRIESGVVIEANVQYKGLLIITGVYYQHEGY
jgi:mRNA-degrading endonuclease RelE of RelBE toxin-antitoxin system